MPAPYEVVLDVEAARFLSKLDTGESSYLRKILTKRLVLAPKDYGSPLKGEKLQGVWKLRTGRWRIFYEVDERKQRVVVLLIDSRDEKTYRRVERKL